MADPRVPLAGGQSRAGSLLGLLRWYSSLPSSNEDVELVEYTVVVPASEVSGKENLKPLFLPLDEKVTNMSWTDTLTSVAEPHHKKKASTFLNQQATNLIKRGTALNIPNQRLSIPIRKQINSLGAAIAEKKLEQAARKRKRDLEQSGVPEYLHCELE